MKFKTAVLCCIFSFMLVSFSENNKPINTGHLIKIAINKVDNTEIVKLSKFINAVKIIPLSYNDSTLIGKIKKVLVFNNNIYIQDKHNSKYLFVFDKKGKFINMIGRSGQGPHEFIELTDFSIDKDGNICIYDCAGQKVVVYNTYGDFIKSVPVPFYADNFCISNGCYYLFRDNPQLNSKYSLNVYTDNGKLIQSYFSVRPGYVSRVSSDIFIRNDNDNSIVFHKDLNDTIYLLNKDELSARYFVDFGQKAINNTDKRFVKRHPQKAMKLLYTKGYAYGIKNPIVVNNKLFFSYTYESATYYAIYDIASKQVYNSINIIDDLTYLFYTNPISQYEDNLIGVIPPTLIGANIKHIVGEISELDSSNKHTSNAILHKLKKASNGITSNPVIVLYEVRKS